MTNTEKRLICQPTLVYWRSNIYESSCPMVKFKSNVSCLNTRRKF